jgi:ATP-binding cassette subfamily A (ABC1) protein 3
VLGIGWAWGISVVHFTKSLNSEIYANQTQGLDVLYQVMKRFAPYCSIDTITNDEDFYHTCQRGQSAGSYCIDDTDFCFDLNAVQMNDLWTLFNSKGPMPIPSLDTFIACTRLLNQASAKNQLKQYDTDRFAFLANILHLGKLHFTPDDDAVRDLVSYLNQTYVFFNDHFGGIHDDEDDAVQMALSFTGDDDRVWAVINCVNLDVGGGNVEYTIRMNYSTIPHTNALSTSFHIGFDETYKQYIISGFSSIQQAMDVYILSKADGKFIPGTTDLLRSPNADRALIVEVPFPTHEYRAPNPLFATIGPFGGLFIALSIAYSFSATVKYLVELKEKGLLELMRVSGLKMHTWFVSNYLSQFLQYIIIAIGTVSILSVMITVHSSWSMLFVFSLMFFLTLIPFSFILLALFSSAKMAGIGSPMILFLLVLPRYGFFSSTQNDEFVLWKFLCCLLSPSAFAFGADNVMSYEASNIGLQWQFLQFDSGHFSFATVLVTLAIDLILYTFIAYMLHIGYSGGVSRKYWITNLFSFSCFKGKTDSELRKSRKGSINTTYVEPVINNSDENIVLSIQDLHRSFKSWNGTMINAVRGLNLDIYDSQITAFLGHNSAGKSTSIKMMTGLLEPSSGDCFIDGVSVYEGKHAGIGVCPQHNVMFDFLTVEEHLYLFAIIKGVPPNELVHAVDELIQGADLQLFRQNLVGTLSGGFQRKLAVAIALIGDPRVVVLDEPTAAMDPMSRRKIWDLMRSHKQGKAMVLTTHFLDEADILGDRIAIMAKGKLFCVGSSLFLKSRFGIGYTLTISLDLRRSNPAHPSSASEDLKDLVCSSVNDAELFAVSAGEVSFTLPFASSHQFSKLFDVLEKDRRKLGVGSFGVSVTTLEEVFMKISLLQEEENELNLPSPSPMPLSSSSVDESKDRDNKNRRRSSRVQPLLNVLATNKRVRSQNLLKKSMLRQFMALIYKRFICTLRDWKNKFIEGFLTVVIVAIALLISSSNSSPAGPRLRLTADAFARIDVNGYTSPITTVPYALFEIDPDVADRLDDMQSIVGQPRKENTSLQLSEYLLDSALRHDGNRYFGYVPEDEMLLRYMNTTPEGAVLGRYWNVGSGAIPESLLPYSSSILHNTTCIHALPIATAEITKALYASLMGTSSVVYSVSSQPLPTQSNANLQLLAYLAVLASLFILLPFSYFPGTFTVFVVKERVVKSKHLQMVSGLSPILYWLASYIWDLLNYAAIAFSVMCLVWIFGFAKGLSQDVLQSLSNPAFGLLLLVYGAAVVPLSYMFSFFFDNARTAQIAVSGINFMSGFVLVIASYILDKVQSTYGVNQQLKMVYRLFPSFNLGEGLINLSSLSLMNSLFNKHNQPLDWEIIGRNVVYLSVESVGYLALVLLRDSGLYQSIFFFLKSRSEAFLRARLLGNDRTDNIRDADQDVSEERERVEKSGNLEDDVVVIKNLTKAFPTPDGGIKHAVDHLSLGILRDQCFGLLGVNGAGKTTAIRIITGDERPTSGTVTVNGIDVVNNLSRAKEDIGYCPQFDPILEEMTARETLAFYAVLRGIPASLVDAAAGEIIDLLGLTQYADKPCGTYSGGNKRKLSLGMALLGSPSVIILDEPSAGMDPDAKRKLWNSIDAIKHERSVILTTHGMDECEALCDRLAIMVSGRLQCLGSIQHLKGKYGSGYQLQLSVQESLVNKACDFLAKAPLLKDAVLDDIIGNTITLHLAPPPPLSQLFDLIEASREEIGVLFYSVSQCTLEQVFLSIAASTVQILSKKTPRDAEGLGALRSPRSLMYPDAEINATPRKRETTVLEQAL